MTYPATKFIESFLNNSNGVLSKSFIDTLRGFYGESLARVTFILALDHFVNKRSGLGFSRFSGIGGAFPYALILPEGAPYSLRTAIREIDRYGAYYLEDAGGYDPLSASHTLGLGDFNVGCFVSRTHYSGETSLRRDNRYCEAVDVMRQRFVPRSQRNVKHRYYDKTYDLILDSDYTEVSALITALDADPMFSGNNRRNWV